MDRSSYYKRACFRSLMHEEDSRCTALFPRKNFIAYITAADLWKDLLKLPVEMHDPVMIIYDINARFRSKIISIHMYIPVRPIYYIVFFV